MKFWLPRLLLFIALALSYLPRSAFAAEDVATEVDAALAKLDGASYRKRDEMSGMMARGSGLGMKMVTEVAGDRSRLLVEMQLPQFGKMTTEQIKIGNRTAVRTSAPGMTAKLEAAKRDMTLQSAKNLMRQVVQVAMAIQTGGLSTAQMIMEAANAALTAKTTAEARKMLDRVLSSFDSWKEMKPESEEDEAETRAAMAEAGYTPPPAGTPSGMGSDFMDVTKKLSADGKTAQYTRRPKMKMPAGADFYSIVYVDTSNGVPTAEENFVNGQRVMRTEYFDFGAKIVIETPDCLK